MQLPFVPAMGANADGVRLSPSEIALLRIIGNATGPVGARLATRELATAGQHLSEASTSRIFRRLDDEGLTVSVGRKGRIVTPQGRDLITTIARNQRRNEDFGRALRVNTLDQLADLLSARRGLEREAAREAALRRTRSDLASLRRTVRSHQQAYLGTGDQTIAGLEFHRELVRSSGNALIQAMAVTVLDEAIEPLERILDVITSGHGTQELGLNEHIDIYDAIRDRDADAAEMLMHDHLGRLINEVRGFAVNGQTDFVERLLRFVS